MVTTDCGFSTPRRFECQASDRHPAPGRWTRFLRAFPAVLCRVRIPNSLSRYASLLRLKSISFHGASSMGRSAAASSADGINETPRAAKTSRMSTSSLTGSERSSTAALRRRTAERDELKARVERAERPRAMSAAQITELVDELGGLSAVLGAASGAERAQVYANLGLRLDYDPYLRRVKATADLSRVAGCVIAASPLNTLHRLGRECEHSSRSPQSCVRGGSWPSTTRVVIFELHDKSG
jgi:hypothetical protein